MTNPKKSAPSFITTNKNIARAFEQQQRLLGIVAEKVGADAVAEEKKRRQQYEIIGRMVLQSLEHKSQAEALNFFAEIEVPIRKSERAIISTLEVRPEGVDEIVAKADAEALAKKEEAALQKAQEDLERKEQAFLKAKEKAAAKKAKTAKSAVVGGTPETDAAPDQATEADDKPADKK